MTPDAIKWLFQQAPVVVVMGIVIYQLWKSYQKEVQYNKDQDKDNLKHLNELTSVLDKLAGFQKLSKEETAKLAENVALLRKVMEERSQKILDHLKDKE